MRRALLIFVILSTAGTVFARDIPLSFTGYGSRLSLGHAQALVYPEDNPSFKDVSFDDSRWKAVDFGTNLLNVFSTNTRIAWYRLHVRFPEKLPERELSVFLGEIYDIDETYFNGAKIGGRGTMTAGNPVRHAYEWDRVYTIPTPLIKPGKDNVLAIRVQGPFDRKLGVMNTGPYITATEDYNRQFFIGGFSDLAFIIVYLVITAYFLLFFIRRPKEKDYVYFGFYTLSVAVYSFLRTEFRYLVSENFCMLKKIEYMVLYVAVALFPAYIYSFFRKKTPLPVKIYYALMFCAFLTIAFTDSPQFWSVFNLYAQIVFGIAFLFPFALMFGQLKKNRDAKYILFSFLLLLIGTVNDILVSRDILHTPLLTAYMFFAVTVSLAIILANRFVRVNEEVEDLNANLEKKVEVRTIELNIANRELRKKQDVIDEEMKVAERVQITLVPQGANLPEIPGLEFGALYKPMEDIGGDIYDIVRIDNTNIGFLIADVSGHGVPSALITTMLKAIYSNNAKPGRDISDIARSVNDEMVKMIADTEQFFTAFYGIIDMQNRKFTYTNSGHYPVLMRRSGTGELVSLTSDGTIGGKFTGLKFGQGEQSFGAGDGFLFYTDGILEARNRSEDYYGSEKLKDMLKQHGHLEAGEFIRVLYSDLENYCDGFPADDDRTMLYVKVL